MSPCDSDLWTIDIAAKEGWRSLKTGQDSSGGFDRAEGEVEQEGECGVERKSYHALTAIQGEVYRESSVYLEFFPFCHCFRLGVFG